MLIYRYTAILGRAEFVWPVLNSPSLLFHIDKAGWGLRNVCEHCGSNFRYSHDHSVCSHCHILWPLEHSFYHVYGTYTSPPTRHTLFPYTSEYLNLDPLSEEVAIASLLDEMKAIMEAAPHWSKIEQDAVEVWAEVNLPRV